MEYDFPDDYDGPYEPEDDQDLINPDSDRDAD